jgi:hypothetical protein
LEFGQFCRSPPPGGRFENSPAVHCWVRIGDRVSPAGTAESARFVEEPNLLSSEIAFSFPTLGIPRTISLGELEACSRRGDEAEAAPETESASLPRRLRFMATIRFQPFEGFPTLEPLAVASVCDRRSHLPAFNPKTEVQKTCDRGRIAGARRSRRFTVGMVWCVGEPQARWTLKRPEGLVITHISRGEESV